MTVILDPGNNASSWTDGVARLWSATAALWKTAAGSAYDGGAWLSGTLWSTIAATRGAAAYTGGAWGSGSLWSTEAATRGGAAYDSGTWGSGTLWSSHASTRGAAAYDGGAWGSGTLWSTVAANRLAAGSSATPAYATSTSFTNFGGGNGNWATLTLGSQSQSGLTFWTNSTTLTAPVTGVYVIAARMNVTDADQNGLRAGIRLLRNGSVSTGQIFGTTDSTAGTDNVVIQAEGTHDGDNMDSKLGLWCLVQLSAGDTIQLQGYHSWGQTRHKFLCVFVPTPTYPH